MHLSLRAVGNGVPKGCRASVVRGIIYCLLCGTEKSECHFIEVRSESRGQKSFPRRLK